MAKPEYVTKEEHEKLQRELAELKTLIEQDAATGLPAVVSERFTREFSALAKLREETETNAAKIALSAAEFGKLETIVAEATQLVDALKVKLTSSRDDADARVKAVTNFCKEFEAFFRPLLERGKVQFPAPASGSVIANALRKICVATGHAESVLRKELEELERQ